MSATRVPIEALGGCTAMTLRTYADPKERPLEGVTVRLSHSKVHARDCTECKSGGGYVDQFEREIELPGTLDADQRWRLLDIAERCPIRKTPHGEVSVRTTPAPGV